jgi:glycosyltransferase involved in cell wall biosynthesis
MARHVERHPYIVMLVPHEPTADPRIKWVASLCKGIARTDILASVDSLIAPHITVDGDIWTERTSTAELASHRSLGLGLLGHKLLAGSSAAFYSEFKAREMYREQVDGDEAPPRSTVINRLRYYYGGAIRSIGKICRAQPLISAMRRRAEVVSLAPRLVICHDIYALSAAIRLKRLYGCKVVYDCHEFWPDADLLSNGLDSRLVAAYEGPLIRAADLVVTVNAPLAEYLRKFYGARRILAVPNAEPLDANRPAPPSDRGRAPVIFLLQGQATVGRGIDTLLRRWNEMALPPSEAVLQVRTPDNPYVVQLKQRYAQPVAEGRIAFLPAVPEEDLVRSAAAADVGVIPYPDHNINHRYCCPNKLSQYFQAGLAVTANATEYVASVLQASQAGWTYDERDAESFRKAVRAVVGDRAELLRRRRQAYDFATRHFHWDAVAREYRAVIAALFCEAEDRAAATSAGMAA